MTKNEEIASSLMFLAMTLPFVTARSRRRRGGLRPQTEETPRLQKQQVLSDGVKKGKRGDSHKKIAE
jgi:hypothetical protein